MNNNRNRVNGRLNRIMRGNYRLMGWKISR